MLLLITINRNFPRAEGRSTLGDGVASVSTITLRGVAPEEAAPADVYEEEEEEEKDPDPAGRRREGEKRGKPPPPSVSPRGRPRSSRSDGRRSQRDGPQYVA